MNIKSNNLKLAGLGRLILFGLIIAVVLPTAAYCQDGIALLIQKTPPQGGSVTPGTGVHHLGLNSEVTLTANPKPGYQFVYWIGDVSDSTSSTTMAYLDSPKIIIAVFERAEYAFLEKDEAIRSAPNGGMYGSASDYSRQGYTGGGGRRSSNGGGGGGETPDPESDPFPIPEPIPEPATAILLTIGSLVAFVNRKKSESNSL